MDLTAKTSRELTAMHAGYESDALATLATLATLAPRLLELAGSYETRAAYLELAARYSLLLSEAKASQARSREVFGEIARRCGMPAAEQTMHGGRTSDGTRYCRTCGFTDCPGAESGDCPRWPAREVMTEARDA